MEREIDSEEEKRSDRWRDNVCGLKTGSRRVKQWSYCFPRERRWDWRSTRDGEEERETLLLNEISEATGSSCYHLPFIDFTDTKRCIYRVPISVDLTCAVSNTDLKTTHLHGEGRYRHRDTISQPTNGRKWKNWWCSQSAMKVWRTTEIKKKKRSEKTLAGGRFHLINM